MRITHVWTGYQLDAAVLSFGTWVENKMDETDKRGRRIHSLYSLLAPTPKKGEEAEAPKAYRSIKESGTMRKKTIRKVHVKEDGTW